MFTARGRDGGTNRVQLFSVGDNFEATNTSSNLSSTMDLTGGAADFLVGTLYVGRGGNAATGSAVTTGVLTYEKGTIDALTVEIGHNNQVTTQNPNGTINVNGTALLTVANDIRLARKLGTGNAVGALNVGTGTVKVAGNIVDGGGASTVTLSGGTIDLMPTGDTTPGTLSAKTVTLNSGSVLNVSQISGEQISLGSTTITGSPSIELRNNGNLDVGGQATTFTIPSGGFLRGSGVVTGNLNIGAGGSLTPGLAAAPGVPAVPGTLTFNNNLTLANNTSLTFKLSNSTTEGSGINDLVNVFGTLTFSGTTGVTIRTLPGGLTSGSYRLFNYNGAIVGGGTNLVLSGLALDSRRSFAIDASTPFQINLTVGGSDPLALTWDGGANSKWNLKADANFKNGATPEKFYQQDAVTFDDTATSTAPVELVGDLGPVSVNVNATRNYTFTGAGRLTGPTGITKDGSGTLILANDGANDYQGNTTINAGTLQVGNGGTSGNLSASPVANNAALVFNRSDDYTFAGEISGGGTVEQRGPGVLTLSAVNTYTGNTLITAGTLRPTATTALGDAANSVVVSGSGSFDVNGINYGTKQFTLSGAGVGSNGAVVNTGAQQLNALRNVTLAGDVTFGGTGRWDIRGGSSAVASLGNLSTGGQPFKITKTGTNQVNIVNVNVDPALGDIEILGGILGYEANTQQLGDPTKTITVQSGGTLSLWSSLNPLNKQIVLNPGGQILNNNGNNSLAATATITLNGGTVSSSNSTFTIPAPVTVAADSFINTSGGAVTLTGTLSGTNSLTKVGASGNTLSFNGDASGFSGSVNATAGTVQILNSTNPLGNTSKITLTNSTTTFGGTGTRLLLNGTNGSVVLNSTPLQMTGAFSGTNELRTSIASANGDNTFGGPINIDGPVNAGIYADSGTFTLNSNITGNLSLGLLFRGASSNAAGILNGTVNTPAANFNKTDNATWTVNSTGNNWANTMVQVGKLILGANDALATNAPLTMGQNDGASPILELNGFNQTVGGLSIVQGSGGTKTITNSSGTLSTLTVNYNGTATTTFTQPRGAITGNLALTKAGTGTLALNGSYAYTGDTRVTGGVLSVNGTLANTPSVTAETAGTYEALNNQVLKRANINTGGTVRIGRPGTATTAVTVLTVGDNTATYADAANSPLNLNGGKLDLGNNAAILDYAPGSDAAALAYVKTKAAAGFGAGTWTGNGINSSAAAANASASGVGYALSSEVVGASGGTFLGAPVDGDAVVARYTLLGDATLDALVDFNDLVKLAQNYNTTDGTRTWFTGDFTYDGNVDFNDLVKLAQNYNTALPTEAIPGAPADFGADLAAAFAAVPEPGALSLLGLAACGLAGRRRRRSTAARA